MDNALLSLSGNKKSFMPVDRYMEHQVNQLKTVYPSAARAETRKFWQESVAPNIMHFRNVLQNVSSSTSTPRSGTKHSSVNDLRDTKLLMELVATNRVLRFTGGRVGYSAEGSTTNQLPQRNKDSTRYYEVHDLISKGKKELRKPDVIRKCREAIIDEFDAEDNNFYASWSVNEEYADRLSSADEMGIDLRSSMQVYTDSEGSEGSDTST